MIIPTKYDNKITKKWVIKDDEIINKIYYIIWWKIYPREKNRCEKKLWPNYETMIKKKDHISHDFLSTRSEEMSCDLMADGDDKPT